MAEPRILDKIEKLLRLSRSSNEHEAALAAARAAELMLEHQISEAELGQGEALQIVDEPMEAGKALRSWRAIILIGLVEEFGCRSFKQVDRVVGIHKLTGERVSVKKVGVSLHVLGRPDDVACVRYVFLYLVAEVKRLAATTWREGRRAVAGGSIRKWHESFRLGAAFVIRDRIRGLRSRRLEEAAAAGCKALMVVREHDAAVQAAYDALQLESRDVRRVGPSDLDGYYRGAAAGRAIDLGVRTAKGLPSPLLRLRGDD